MSKLLTEYHVAIGADTAKFVKQMGVARHEVSSVVKTLRESEPAANKLAREIANLDKVFAKGGMGSEQYALALEHLEKKYSSTESKARSLIGTVAKLYAAMQFGQFIKESVKLSAELENIGIQFETLTGSRRTGQELVAAMRELDATTSLTFGGIARAGQTLLSFGVEADKVIPILRRIGEISGSDEERLKSLSLAFAQVASAGRLMGQDLLQMVQQGFNPLQVISEKTGISMLDLKKKMEDGAISADLVNIAFEDATSAGGIFFERLKSESEGAIGRWRALTNEVTVLKTELGEQLLPVASDLMGVFKELTSSARGDFGALREVIFGIRWQIAALKDAWANLSEDGSPNRNLEKLAAEEAERLTKAQGRIEDEWKRRKAKAGNFDALRQAGVGEKEIEMLRKEVESADKRAKQMQDMLNAGDQIKQEEKDKKAQDKEENAAIKTAQRELEQAQKRLEIEKFGKAIAEKNEALRKGMTEADAERVRLLVQETEQLDAQQKLSEKIKRDSELEKQKLQEAEKKAMENTSRAAPTLRAGTQEAYKAIFGNKNTQEKQLERQIAISKAMLEAQKESNKHLSKLQPLQAIR